MTEETPPQSQTVKRILRTRGDVPASKDKSPSYVASELTAGHPQMGFSVCCANGDRHGFFFHNLDNLQLVERDYAEILSFTHRGKAVTLRGQKLHEAFQGIMDHTLQKLCEYRANHDPEPILDAPIIDRVKVDDLIALERNKSI